MTYSFKGGHCRRRRFPAKVPVLVRIHCYRFRVQGSGVTVQGVVKGPQREPNPNMALKHGLQKGLGHREKARLGAIITAAWYDPTKTSFNRPQHISGASDNRAMDTRKIGQHFS